MPRPDHLYRKLLEDLRRQAVNSFVAGETLPSQRALAFMHGVGQATVNRALQTLEKEGLVRASPRIGWVRTEGGKRRAQTSPGLRIGILTRRNQAEVERGGNPIYAALREEAARRGWETVFHTNPRQHHPTPGRNRLELSRVAWNSFDVALVVEVEDAQNLDDSLLKKRRVIVVDSDATPFGLDSVIFDDHETGRLAARHFFELGHRSFAVGYEVNEPGWPCEGTWMTRRHGFEAESGRLGGVIEPEALVMLGRHRERYSAVQVAKDLVARWQSMPDAKRPTAFFSVEGHILAALIEALAAKGLRVPADLSVITVDWGSVQNAKHGLRYTNVRLDLQTLVRRTLDAAAGKTSEKDAQHTTPRLHLTPVVLEEGNTTAPRR